MPAILPGYEYDIFISYRHKDNKLDGWVTEFVTRLRNEIEATFKEDISIYFDENPHDGLHETHDVDGSLKEKIKCLVFIPIVSQTYCDPNSFAWQQELLPFLEFARNDQFGLDLKVIHGNVAKRVLPVRIHDIDPNDQSLFEAEVGGVMRPVDFIYQSTGVNRPLRSVEEHAEDNQNKTIYRDQINKVANAIKGLIQAMKNPVEEVAAELPEKAETKKPRVSFLNIALGIIGLTLIFAMWYAFGRGDSEARPAEDYTYDVALLYIENLTQDDNYADGLVNLIQYNLAEDTSLRLVPRPKMYQELRKLDIESKNPDMGIATDLAKSLDARLMITGRVIEQGGNFHVQVELTEVDTGEPVISKEFDYAKEEIFELADDISTSLMINESPSITYHVSGITTDNYNAYTLYNKGVQHTMNMQWSEAQESFTKAVELDSNFALAYAGLAMSGTPFATNDFMKSLEGPKKQIDLAYSKSDALPIKDKLFIKMLHQGLYGDSSGIETMKELYRIDPDNRFAAMGISQSLFLQGDENYIVPFEKYYERNIDNQAVNNELAYQAVFGQQDEKALKYAYNYFVHDSSIWNTRHTYWEIFLMTGEPEKALPQARIIERDKNSRGRPIWTGLTHLLMHKPDSALATFERHRDDNVHREYYPLGYNAHLMKGEYQKAIELAEEIRLEASEIKRPYVECFTMLDQALMMISVHKFEEADKILNELESIAAEKLDFNPFLALVPYYKGLNNYERDDLGSFQKNISEIDASIERLDHRFNIFSLLLKQLLAYHSDPETFELPADQAFRYSLQSPWVLEPAIDILINKGEYESAMDLLDNINRFLYSGRPLAGGNQTRYILNVRNIEFHRGRVYEKMGQNDKAIESYSAFLELLSDSDTTIPEKEVAIERLKELN